MSYCATSDIQNVFGTDNVTRWSQLDNSLATADSTRIAAAIAYADDEINNSLRGGPYTVPLSPVDSTITRWAAVIAGVWLYNSRGQRDEGDENQYGRMLSDVYNDIAMVKGGVKRLTATRAWGNTPSSPAVVG